MRLVVPLVLAAVIGGCGMNEAELLADDESHPIPYVDNVDVLGEKKDGGTSWAIVIANPLDSDERSKKRFEAKVAAYVSAINSAGYKAKYGPPTAESVDILVEIHRDSAPVYFERLEEMREWMRSRNITLLVERL